MNYVPNLNFQTLAVASPALKAQKIHQRLLPNLSPVADEPVKFGGGTVELLSLIYHSRRAKIER
jgi:hypothetical protein